MNESFVEIAALLDAFEAAYLSASLEKRRVKFKICENRDSAFGGLLPSNQAWGTVFAPENCRRIIESSIIDYRSRPSR